MKLYNESLEISRQLGDQYMVAGTLNNMGMIHGDRREYDQAMKLYNESLEISRQLGDRQEVSETLNNMAITLNNISSVYLERQEYEEAFYNASQAHEILGGLGSPEVQRSIDILSNIKEKVGNDAYY